MDVATVCRRLASAHLKVVTTTRENSDVILELRNGSKVTILPGGRVRVSGKNRREAKMALAQEAHLDNKLRTAMMSLFYPAFLGTFIVAAWSSSQAIAPDRMQLSILLIVYFVLAFVETETTDAADYDWKSFLADCLEIVLMFAVFVMLHVGTMKLGFDVPIFRRNSPDQMWALLCFTFALPFLTRLFSFSHRSDVLDVLCVLAMTTCFLASQNQLGWFVQAAQQVEVLDGVLVFLYRWPFWQGAETFLQSDSSHAAHAMLWILLLIYLGCLLFDANTIERCFKNKNAWNWNCWKVWRTETWKRVGTVPVLSLATIVLQVLNVWWFPR